jgi:hypothetical protein
MKNAGSPVDPSLWNWAKQAAHDEQGSERGGDGDDPYRHCFNAMPLDSVGRMFGRTNLNAARCLKVEIEVVVECRFQMLTRVSVLLPWANCS